MCDNCGAPEGMEMPNGTCFGCGEPQAHVDFSKCPPRVDSPTVQKSLLLRREGDMGYCCNGNGCCCPGCACGGTCACCCACCGDLSEEL